MPAERINAMSPASPLRVAERQPPALRRSWLFCPGADREALLAARGCGADVLIQELEDFTPPERRPDSSADRGRPGGRW
jgi:citrate lyase subunit beta/citryl-CoA lyase